MWLPKAQLRAVVRLCFLLDAPANPSIQQAFVEEMATEGKVLWLKEFSSTNDKLGLVAKVPLMMHLSLPCVQAISCSSVAFVESFWILRS